MYDGRWRSIGSLPVVLLALALFGYLGFDFFVSQAPPKPDAVWTRIQTDKVLRIGVDPSSPPFVVDDGKGNLSGLDVALANVLASQWGVKIQYVYTGYDGLYDALNGKQFDMILSALPYNPTKTQDVLFSRAYFNNGPVLVARGDDAAVTGIDKLGGQTLGVELGSSGDAAARKWQKRYAWGVKQFDTTTAALRALEQGQVRAAMVDPIALYDFQRAASDTAVKQWRIVGKPLAEENYVIAVRQDSPTLLWQVNAVIDALRREGKLEELERENF